jgi:hypothetical protein
MVTAARRIFFDSDKTPLFHLFFLGITSLSLGGWLANLTIVAERTVSRGLFYTKSKQM